jgi:cation diffusion facilitator family transporter
MHLENLSQWQPHHVFLGAGHATHELRTRLIIVLTAVMMVVEIAAGLAFGSMALLADGWHMATHAGALGLTALGYAYSRRHTDDPRFSFGTGKIGDLAGFSSALILALIAALMAYESVVRLYAPEPIAFDEAIAVAVLGLAVNLVSAYLLGTGHHGHVPDHDGDHADDHDDDHDHEHDRGHAGHAHAHGHHADHNIRSAYVHVLADALTSILAIVALIAGRFYGWVWLDPVMGVVGGVVIARWSFGLMRDTARVLLDCDPTPGLAATLRAAIEAPTDDADGDRVADLHVWRVGPGHLAVVLSLVTHHPHAPAHYKALIARHVRSTHVTVEVNACT